MQKTNSFSLSALVVANTGAPYWGILASYLFYKSENAVLLSMIIGFILSLIIIKGFLILFNRFTDKTFVGKVKLLFGKFSIVLNTLFILFAFSMYIYLTYRLTAFLSSQYLIETPKYYMHLLIIFTTFYMASKDIEALARVSTISLFLAVFIFLSIFFSLLGSVEFSNYLPFFTVSFVNILESSIVFAIYFSAPVIFVTAIKKDQIVDKEKFNKTFYLMLTLSIVMFLLAGGTTLGILGIKLTNLFEYPLYSVLKKISLFSFIDSIENVSILLWVLYVINSTSMILYSIISAAKETYNAKKGTLIIIILFLLSYIIPKAFLMENTYAENIEYTYIPLISYIAMIVLVIIVLIFSKKKM